MSDEQTALLSGNGAASSSCAVARSLKRLSRFGPFESAGVRPSRESMAPEFLRSISSSRSWRSSSSAAAAGGRRSVRARGIVHGGGDFAGGGGGVGADVKRRASAQSFMQTGAAPRAFVQDADGSISALTPLEMGRHELYEELPFLAVPGLQRKEHNLSVAFSSFAAFLDNKETDRHLMSTTGEGLKPEEKEKRLSRVSLLMLEELEVEAVSVTLPLVCAVFIASLLQFNVGYNIGVMNPSEVVAFPGHTTLMWSIAVSAFCVGAPFGSAVAGRWADESGRRGALLLTTWLFLVGGLVQTVAPTLPVVVVARAIIGVASGASTVLVPIYLGELAPPNLRGVIGTMTQFSLNTGILAADILGFPFVNKKLWRCLYLMVSIMGAIPLLLRPFLLESPRWLLGRDARSEEARFAIKKLRGFRYDEEVETEVEHYVDAMRSQSMVSKDGGKRNAMAELFSDKKVRLLLVSSLVLQVANQLSGINAVFYYSGLFFNGVLNDPLVGTTLMGAINVLATYIAVVLMDRCGRRTLVLWSSGGMCLSCILLVLSLLGYFGKMVALAAVAAYVALFQLGLGPIPSLIVAEMFESKYVTTAMSVCSQLNWTCNFFVSLLFPYMDKYLGPYSFGPFTAVLLLTFLYAWIFLPETQGTTPAELQTELVRKNAGVTYHNMDIEGMSSSLPHLPLKTGNEWADAFVALAEEEGLV